MDGLTGSIRIDASVEEVFEYVDDWRNPTKFMRGLGRWEPVDPGRDRGVGARFAVILKAGPVNLKGEIEVTEHEPPLRLAYRSVAGIKLAGTWSFSADGEGTLAELTNTFELPGGIPGRVLRKVVQSQGQRDLVASLAELKRLVETGG